MLTTRIPRSRPEVIVETRVEVMGAMVTLRKNLGPLALTQMMTASREGALRGLMSDGAAYYWDAFYATHDEVARALGIDAQPDDLIRIWRVGQNDNENESKVLVDLNEPISWPPAPLEKLTASPNIYFLDMTGKWKNGDQLAA